MNWVVFSYSLPSKSGSSARVALWRRLRRLGAISPTGSIYVLPAQEACIEAFQWLAQEIQQAQGHALVMHVTQFEGLSDPQLINLFREARQADYAEIATHATVMAQALTKDLEVPQLAELQDNLAKLQRQHGEVVQIDYFDSPEGAQVAGQLAEIARTLTPETAPRPAVTSVVLEAYQHKTWVTRPKPHVDRLGCIWLIRHFIDPQATIRYTNQPEADEITFDMSEADFGHTGNLCTFETMIQAFALETPPLARLSEIVHEVDLRDERYFHPEVSGVAAILQGWLHLDLSDNELEMRGLALFEGLFALFSTQAKEG